MQAVEDIVYFEFERDFVEENVRCIPMIIRFKMDKAGIKLELSVWSRFSSEERIELANRPCNNVEEVNEYRNYLSALVRNYAGKEATDLKVEQHPAWADFENINETLKEKANEFDWEISVMQWKNLTNLQRFVLLKLCRPGHENKNFPKAMKEFGLIESIPPRSGAMFIKRRI